MTDYKSIFIDSPLPSVIIAVTEDKFILEDVNDSFTALFPDYQFTVISAEQFYLNLFEQQLPGLTVKIIAALSETRISQKKKKITLVSEASNGENPFSLDIDNRPVEAKNGKITRIVQYFTFHHFTANLTKHPIVIDLPVNIHITENNPGNYGVFWLKTNAEKIITAAHPDFCNLSGYASDELIGRSLNILDSGWHWKEYLENMERTISSGNIFLGIVRNKKKNGEFYWQNTTIVPYAIQNGKPTGYLYLCNVITNYKRIDEFIEDFRKEYIELLDFQSVPSWIYNNETFQYLYVNDAAIKLYGYSREEFLQMNLRDVRPTEDVPILEKVMNEDKDNYQNSYSFLFRHQKKNGEILFVKIENKKVNFGGTVARLAIAIDMTNELNYQNKLVETNKWLESAQQMAHLGYWMNDLVTGKIFWSDELYRIFGLEKESIELNLENIRKLYHPDEKLVFPENNGAFPEKNNLLIKDRRIWCGPGKTKWITERINVIANESGKVIRLEGIVFDIDKLKIAENSLKSSEEKYRNLFNYNPLPTWIYDVDSLNFIDVNEAACRHYGYSREEFIQITLKEIRPAEEIALMEKAVNEAKTKNHNDNFNIYRHRKKNGEIIFVRIESNEIKIDSRHTRMVVVVDITESLLQQKSIVEYNKKLQTSQEIARLGYWSMNLATGELIWSDAVYTILEINPETFKLTFANFKSRVHPDDLYLLESPYLQLTPQNANWEVEHRFITDTGKIKWVYSKLQLEADHENGPLLEGVLMDITERKIGENALRKKSQLLSALNKFVSGLLTNENWLHVLEKFKDIIGETMGIDRIFYFENLVEDKTGKQFGCLKLKWHKNDEEYKADYSHILKAPFSEYRILTDVLEKREKFMAFTSQLPSCGFKTSLEHGHVKSILSIPIFVLDNFYGFVNFHDCKTERVWEEDEILFLESMVMNIATKIEKDIATLASDTHKAQFESVIRNLPGISIRRKVGKNWPILLLNDEVERITGYSPGDIMYNRGITWEDMMHPDDREMVVSKIRNLNPGEIFDIEYRMICKDGRTVWLRGRGRAILNEFGENEYIDGVMVDITELHYQQEQLLESNERFTMVMKATLEAILDWNIMKNTIVWGKGFAEVFGYETSSQEKNTGLWLDNIHTEDKEQVLINLKKCIDDKITDQFYAEFRFIKADGSIAYVQQRGIFMRNKKGTAIRAVFAMMDVTQTMLRMNEIKHQNETLREIAWTQSHVVRAPLATLLSLVDFLKARDFAELGEDFLLDNIIKTTQKLDKVIHEIIDKASSVRLD